MRFFFKKKDGGPESKVTGYWLIEWKKVFSIVLLHFGPGTRDMYHAHAFNASSWLLRGRLQEGILRPHDIDQFNLYLPSLRAITTPRTCIHKVASIGDSWVLSFRGPWADTWIEWNPKTNKIITLTHGRQVIE